MRRFPRCTMPPGLGFAAASLRPVVSSAGIIIASGQCEICPKKIVPSFPLPFYFSCAILPSVMQGWYIGITAASQAVKAGSIPVPCSTPHRTMLPSKYPVFGPGIFYMLCRCQPFAVCACGANRPKTVILPHCCKSR